MSVQLERKQQTKKGDKGKHLLPINQTINKTLIYIEHNEKSEPTDQFPTITKENVNPDPIHTQKQNPDFIFSIPYN